MAGHRDASAATGAARGSGRKTVTASHAEDRVLPESRRVALFVSVILVPAVVVLWGLPGKTADLWAWTIKPDLTPIFIGAGFAAGSFFFWQTFQAEHWHPSSAGVLSASVFAVLMLVATLIHWDRFNHGDAPALAAIAFYAWTGLYIVSPPMLLAVWIRNRRTDRCIPWARDAAVPRGARLVARSGAVAVLAAAAVAYLSPQTAIDLWPWQLSPLTARVLAGFTAQVGIAALVLSLDSRWSAWRLIVQAFFIATAFLLVGARRAWDDFDDVNLLTWLYLAGLLGSAAALGALYQRMERSAAASASRA